jgi:hypothetical protein
MKIKISDKTISLPPYISTSWNNVDTLRLEADSVLVLVLKDATSVHVPNLEGKVIEQIFEAHAKAVEMSEEQKTSTDSPMQQMTSLFKEGGIQMLPLQFSMGGEGMEGVEQMMQHNPDQSNLPPLPEEVLQQVRSVAALLGEQSDVETPEPIEGCHCFYCQISRAVNQGMGREQELEPTEEEVTEEDLRFRSWDIEQMGEQLYKVVNPLDPSEQYSVFLGDPVGCNCGHTGCEHIKAVLNS